MKQGSVKTKECINKTTYVFLLFKLSSQERTLLLYIHIIVFLYIELVYILVYSPVTCLANELNLNSDQINTHFSSILVSNVTLFLDV